MIDKTLELNRGGREEHVCEAYGDCIDLEKAALYKETANPGMVKLVFIGLNVG